MKHSLISMIGITACAQLVAGTVAVSLPTQSSASGGGNSFNPTFSPDGHHLVFVSHANNLVTNDDLGLCLDVFVRDLVNSNTVLVSVSTNGIGGANADANYPSISSNGQFVAFASRANNLIPGDTNDASDVFVRDLVNGATTLVSVENYGGGDPNPSLNIPLHGHPIISENGRWVFFESRSTNFGVPDFNNGTDVLGRDLQTGEMRLVSTAMSGAETAQGTSTLAAVSADGRYVAFISTATNIAASGTNNAGDLYLRDMVMAGPLLCLSKRVGALLPGDYRVVDAALSTDGRYTAFITFGTSNAVFRHDVVSDSTVLIAVGVTNQTLAISADGSRVAFEADSSAQVWDATNATNTLVKVGQISARPQLSGDGRFVAFLDAASTNGTHWDVYLRNLTTGTDTLMSAATNSNPSAADFFFSSVSVSADGSRVAFHSIANDLVADDLNGANDIFVREVSGDATELITKAQPARPASTAFTHSFLGLNSVSADGRFVVTLRYDDPSAFRDTNNWRDVFLGDVISGRTFAVSISSNVYFTNADGGVGVQVSLIENTNAFEEPIISADGSMIYATLRIGGASPGQTRIYGARSADTMSGAGMSLVSRGINVSENGSSYGPSTSSNGMLVAFTSTSTDLIEGMSDLNNAADVFLRRMTVLTNGLLSGSNELISVARLGNSSGNGASSNAVLSPDSRWVVFESRASDLTTNNTGTLPNLYARDLASNVTYLVSVGPSGAAQWGYVPGSFAVSGNSRYVAFSSGNIYLTIHDLLTHTSVIADNPVARFPSLNLDGRFVAYVKRPNGASFDQIYVRDLQSTQIDLISANISGAPGNGTSSNPLLSADGRYVVFQSKGSDLVANDANGANDIFVRDRLLGVTMLVSANVRKEAGNGPSTRPVMAADGRTVVFQSFANDLVTGDYNDRRDVFVLKLAGTDTDGDGMDDDWEVAYFGNLSRNGSGDFDGDGANDLAEFLAGTDPTDSGSIFRVLTVAPINGGDTRVIWSGNSNRNYRVEFKDDLAAAGWSALNGSVAWNGSTASMIDPGATNSTHRYYRVVRLP